MGTLWTDKKRPIFGLPLSFTRYTLTDDRIFINWGVFNKREDEVRLYRVVDVSLTRSLGQRIFGVGTIHCCSSDKSLGDFDIKSVKTPKEVKDLISDQVEQQRIANKVSTREFVEDRDGAYESDLS